MFCWLFSNFSGATSKDDYNISYFRVNANHKNRLLVGFHSMSDFVVFSFKINPTMSQRKALGTLPEYRKHMRSGSFAFQQPLHLNLHSPIMPRVIFLRSFAVCNLSGAERGRTFQTKFR